MTPLEHYERELLVPFPFGVLTFGLGRINTLHLVYEEHRNKEGEVRNEVTLEHELDALHGLL